MLALYQDIVYHYNKKEVIMENADKFLEEKCQRLTDELNILKQRVESLINENSELRKVAYLDKLTGAFNRNYLDDVLKRKYKRINCYLAFVDLNNLKQTNDIFGHDKGDELIINIYKKLKKYGEVVRLGGDEFAVFISKEDPRLIKSFIDRALHDDDYAMGVVEKTESERVGAAMSRADDLMYYDKLRIKNKEEVDAFYIPLKPGETLTPRTK